tara:strand:- start:1566 stop:2906 length:1341 start_codon:yes stop_codon:yes gene_type:complete
MIFNLLLIGNFQQENVYADYDVSTIKIIEVKGVINNVTARYINRSIHESSAEKKQLIIITLDTPGGAYDSTRKIVEDILASKVPIVSYVYPSGAQAASAGTFILSASHIAAMAPTTNMGAATPVTLQGEDLPDTLKSKASQDAAALLRELGKARKRNIEALEATIFDSKAYSSTESIENNLIDFIADDVPELIKSINGMEITIDSQSTKLKSINPKIETSKMTLQENFLNFLADPNILFVLLILGALLIFVEFIFTGLIVPGIAGAIFLVLAFLGSTNLPVNFIGLGFLILAAVLMYVEFSAPGIGIAAFGSISSFLIGGILLFGNHNIPFLPGAVEPSPFLNSHINIWILISSGILLVIPTTWTIWDIKRAQKSKKHLVRNIDLSGETGVAKTILDPRGTVLVQSELWSAETDNNQTIEKDSNIIVSDVDGLTLKVFKSDNDDII